MTLDSKSLFRLTEAEINSAARMLARAFQDNPGIAYYFSEEPERKRILPFIFQYSLRRGLIFGEVHATSPRLEGVAAWLSSENMLMNEQRFKDCGGLVLMSKIGEENASKFISFAEFLGSVHKRCAPFKHWYLLGLGVDPGYQGKGYAGILLKSMLARIDSEVLPCYLETQNEKNLPIYAHYGFKVVEESTIPGTGVTNWAMLREKAG